MEILPTFKFDSLELVHRLYLGTAGTGFRFLNVIECLDVHAGGTLELLLYPR